MKLYHASQQKNLSLLTPQPTKSNDKYIGDYVFATKNYKMALMYLVPKGIPILMNPDDPNIVICSTPKDSKEQDKGGAIYAVPAKSFKATPQEALTNYEMVSQEPVKPINKDVFENVLGALHNAGIKIHFVDERKFQKLLKNPKQKQLIADLPAHG